MKISDLLGLNNMPVPLGMGLSTSPPFAETGDR